MGFINLRIYLLVLPEFSQNKLDCGYHGNLGLLKKLFCT